MASPVYTNSRYLFQNRTNRSLGVACERASVWAAVAIRRLPR